MRRLLWWFAVLAAYVIEFVTQTLSEVAAGAIIAVLCTLLVLTALRNSKPDVRVYWRWLYHLRRIPLGMLRDAMLVSARVVWALRTGEALTGYMTRVKYEYGDRRQPLEIGREALVIYGVCAAPNTVVADIDLRGELLVHQLLARQRASESERWPL